MTPSPTTLPLIRGRLDTMCDRFGLFSVTCPHPRFKDFKAQVEDIRALVGSREKFEGAEVREMVEGLDVIRRELPQIFNQVTNNPRGARPSDNFLRDWNAHYPEINQYLVFIMNRLPSLSEDYSDSGRSTPEAYPHPHPQLPPREINRTLSHPSVLLRSRTPTPTLMNAVPPPGHPPPTYSQAMSQAQFPQPGQGVPSNSHSQVHQHSHAGNARTPAGPNVQQGYEPYVMYDHTANGALPRGQGQRGYSHETYPVIPDLEDVKTPKPYGPGPGPAARAHGHSHSHSHGPSPAAGGGASMPYNNYGYNNHTPTGHMGGGGGVPPLNPPPQLTPSYATYHAHAQPPPPPPPPQSMSGAMAAGGPHHPHHPHQHSHAPPPPPGPVFAVPVDYRSQMMSGPPPTHTAGPTPLMRLPTWPQANGSMPPLPPVVKDQRQRISPPRAPNYVPAAYPPHLQHYANGVLPVHGGYP